MSAAAGNPYHRTPLRPSWLAPSLAYLRPAVLVLVKLITAAACSRPRAVQTVLPVGGKSEPPATTISSSEHVLTEAAGFFALPVAVPVRHSTSQAQAARRSGAEWARWSE